MKKATLAWAVAASLMAGTLPALADIVTYTTSLQSGNMCSGSNCGPYGTISVSNLSSDELSVVLTLTSGEVFAKTGAGAALMFDISGNPTLSVMSLLPTGYSFQQNPTPIQADGSGTWYDYISCDSACGSGTSPPQSSGPIDFDFTLKSDAPITPLSFVDNSKGYLFASDIGIPNGSGGYYTGDVVTTGPLTPVPLPASAWLLLTGLAGLAMTRLQMTRRRRGL